MRPIIADLDMTGRVVAKWSKLSSVTRTLYRDRFSGKSRENSFGESISLSG